MKTLPPKVIILQHTPDLEQTLEMAGRVCYKSEDRITPDSAPKFVEHIKGLHHESVLEHGSITVSITCDRGISHELVRHRLASFSQESTRYCNYGKDKFGGEITFIDISLGFEYDMNNPDHVRKWEIWEKAMKVAEMYYLEMLGAGASPQEARSILPNSTKTEIVITANPREWRHIFKMRTAPSAHPQMREIMIPLQEFFQKRWPSIFN